MPVLKFEEKERINFS